MPSLREVQRAIRAGIVERDDGALAACIASNGITAAQRLSVYSNTFASNLANALRLSFPAVQRLVGAGFFNAAARVFTHRRPPASAYLDEYGGDFPDFLARFAPAASLVYLAGVARLDWAVNRALHAPDVQPLEASSLASVAPIDHGRIRLTVHPAVSLVHADHPVDAIWRAVLARDDAALAAIDVAAGPVWLLVERVNASVDVTRIDERASHFSAALFAGQSLAIALDAASGIDAPALLAQHLVAGRFVGFDLAERSLQEARRDAY